MSDIEKIHGITPDLTRENVDRLLALFPDVATEITDPKTGRTERAVDFDALKERLSDVAEGNRERYSDDGEPAKTAGTPALEVLQHSGLTDLIVVVTRYFGGVLLGTGGLVRAYTTATARALENAEVVTVRSVVELSVTVDYSLYERASLLIDAAGAKQAAPQFTDRVTLCWQMPEHTEGPLLEQLRELTRGGAQVHVSEPFYAPF